MWARCAHELGEVARFGFSELKEAARVADAGAMQIQLRVMHQGNFFGAGSRSASGAKRPASTLTRLCRQYSEGVRVWLWN